MLTHTLTIIMFSTILLITVFLIQPSGKMYVKSTNCINLDFIQKRIVTIKK